MSFPIDINPSISTLVENAQRSNPVYGKKSVDAKKKTSKTKTSLRTAVDLDSMDLSDDMLGDLDADARQGHDHLADFKKKMQQWIDEKEEEEKEKDEEGDQEEGNQREPEDGMNEDKPVESDEDLNKPAKEQVLPSDKLSASEELEETEEEEAEGEQQQDEGRDPVKEAARKDEQAKSQFSDTDIMDIIKGKRSEMERSENREIIEISNKENESLAVLDGPSMEFVSLLSYDDGFIIADSGNKKTQSSATSAYGRKLRDRDKGREKKKVKQPISITPPEFRVRFREVFGKMVLTDNRGIVYENLCQQLKIFGIRVLETCCDSGERVLLIPIGKSLEDYRSLLTQEYNSSIMKMKYGYLPNEHLVVLNEEVILNGNPRIQIPVMYFAHAFDNALGQEGFASEKSPAVISNYNSCIDRERGHIFIDSYSAISPVHYFAQAVEAFLTAPHGQLTATFPDNRDPLCSKEELYDIDRPIYSYIEYLFKQVNRGDEMKAEDDVEIDLGRG